MKDRSMEQPSTINNTSSVIRDTKFICKWCKIPVMSKIDHSAKLGHEHKSSCPRRRLGR